MRWADKLEISQILWMSHPRLDLRSAFWGGGWRWWCNLNFGCYALPCFVDHSNEFQNLSSWVDDLRQFRFHSKKFYHPLKLNSSNLLTHKIYLSPWEYFQFCISESVTECFPYLMSPFIWQLSSIMQENACWTFPKIEASGFCLLQDLMHHIC